MATNVYGKRNLVHVVPFTGSTIKYGFYTNVDAAAQTALGHTAIADALPAGLVIGANAPKPGRATKKTTASTESSFVSAGARDTARTAGWKITPGRIRIASNSTKSKVVYVVHETNKIAWRMPNYLHVKIESDLALLGIVTATSANDDLVFGATRHPKLPRVGKVQADGNKTATYCDPSKLDSLPAGWSTVRASRAKL